MPHLIRPFDAIQRKLHVGACSSDSRVTLNERAVKRMKLSGMLDHGMHQQQNLATFDDFILHIPA